MREGLAFQESKEDTRAYESAAVALKQFAERGLSAANSVEKELTRQKTLDEGDKRKMPPEEVAKWERMLTEVETWTLTVPNLLQQLRVVQYSPQIQERLWDIFQIIFDREQFLTQLGNMRFRALKGSDKNPFSPFEEPVPDEFFQLAAIATTQWMLREGLRVHPDLLKGDRKADLDQYLAVIQALMDWEVEGTWTVDTAGKVDVFILAQTKAQFARQGGAEALAELFNQGRVTIIKKGETEAKVAKPTDTVQPGDIVKMITVFKRSTDRAGTAMEGARVPADQERRRENAERVTQNLPGSVQFAFNVTSQTDVWKRLLTEIGGTSDRSRYAKQLSEDVERFKDEFIGKKAFEAFRKEAQDLLKDANKDNEKARRLIRFFSWVTGKTGSDAISERLTTRPDEFQKIFDEVMKKVEAGFDAVAKPENVATINELTGLLGKMQNGEKLNPASEERLKELLTKYGSIIFETGQAMSAIQAWQVGENVQRVGGAGKPNNLELVTRVNNKSLVQWLAGFSPYGALQTKSYVDRNGRVILLDTLPSFSERGVFSHGVELTKLGLETAGASIILSHILTRIPYLNMIPGFKALMGRVAVPVILAEAQIALTEKMARQERVKIAAKEIDDIIKKLEDLRQRPRKANAEGLTDTATVLASQLRMNLTVLLHVATDQKPEDRRPDLLLEAHVFTNQLMTAFGYPPLSQLDSGIVPETVQDLRDRLDAEGYRNAKISPEVQEYIESRTADKRMDREREGRLNAQKRRMIRDSVEAKQEDPEHQVARGLIPDYLLTVQGKTNLQKNMVAVRDSKEFQDQSYVRSLERLGSNAEEQVAKAYTIAGDVFMMHHKWQKMYGILGKELKRAPVPDDMTVDVLSREFPLDQRGRKKVRIAELDREIEQTLRNYSLHDILTVSRLVSLNPPDNRVLAEQWLHDAYTDNKYVNQYLNSQFGAPSTRTGLATSMLSQWIELYNYYEAYRKSPVAYDGSRELNLSRIKATNFKLFSLPDNHWMVIHLQIVDKKWTGGLSVEMGKNSGNGDGKSVTAGQLVIGDKKFVFSDEKRVQDIDWRYLYPGVRITILDATGKRLAENVPLILQNPN
ncbi:hypothetical protein FJZ28_00595 [Candidatus Peregrinibacteria bacterium]|nr:hypothetical protein [Candidatus Peregrinibacteria bacterium]